MNAPMTLAAALVRLQQYGERTSTWSTATYNDGTEKALHEIALTLAAEVDTLSHELTGANLAHWEDEQDTARLRLALKSARRGRQELRARLVAFEALELGTPEGRISAKCSDPAHPVWLRNLDDLRGCPWCRIAELEAQVRTLAMSALPMPTGEVDFRAIEEERPATAFTHDCGIPLTRRLDCGHCPHEVCQDCDRCPHSCRCSSVEDPHDSPLHHSYALGRDLPEVAS